MAETDLLRLVVDQARAAREVFRAVERYLQGLGPAHAEEARRRAAAAADAARRFESSVESTPAAPGLRKDLFLLSRALGRLAVCGEALAIEAGRFGVPEEPGLQEMAHAARRSAEELADAVERLEGRPPEAQGPALRAARAAGRTEHLRRQATRAAGEEPDAVLAIKLRGLHRRFSEAALHAAEAAELASAMLDR